MGIDLTLGIIQPRLNDLWLTYNRLDFDRHSKLFEYFGLDKNKKVIEEKETPKDVKVEWYDEKGLEQITENAYGEPLTYFLAKDSKNIPYIRTTKWNRAVLNFLKSIPEDTPVVLYWH